MNDFSWKKKKPGCCLFIYFINLLNFTVDMFPHSIFLKVHNVQSDIYNIKTKCPGSFSDSEIDQRLCVTVEAYMVDFSWSLNKLSEASLGLLLGVFFQECFAASHTLFIHFLKVFSIPLKNKRR